MTTSEFQRARSPEAKRAREVAILDAARRLATERGVRDVTLTDIASKVGMHKSALLRYFETREQIFLLLAAEGWRDWSSSLRTQLDALVASNDVNADAAGPVALRPAAVAGVLASTLVARPIFCDLLAQGPLNLERNVSLDSVRSFKLVALGEVAAISEALRSLLPLNATQATNVVTTAGGMAGALWQMAALGTNLPALYQSDPELKHALVEVGPILADILTGLLTGYALAGSSSDSGLVELPRR